MHAFWFDCVEFDEFLRFYTQCKPAPLRSPIHYTKQATRWIYSVVKKTLLLNGPLEAAPKWNFENIKLLAIDNLAASANPVIKIILKLRCNITEGLWGDLHTCADSLSVVIISAARQLYETGLVHYQTKCLAGDLEKVFISGLPSKESILSTGCDVEALEVQMAEARRRKHALILNQT